MPAVQECSVVSGLILSRHWCFISNKTLLLVTIACRFNGLTSVTTMLYIWCIVFSFNRIEFNENSSVLIVKYQRVIWAIFWDHWSIKLQCFCRGNCGIGFPTKFSVDVIHTELTLIYHIPIVFTVDRNYFSHTELIVPINLCGKYLFCWHSYYTHVVCLRKNSKSLNILFYLVEKIMFVHFYRERTHRKVSTWMREKTMGGWNLYRY
jgi:hypothetical protein